MVNVGLLIFQDSLCCSHQLFSSIFLYPTSVDFMLRLEIILVFSVVFRLLFDCPTPTSPVPVSIGGPFTLLFFLGGCSLPPLLVSPPQSLKASPLLSLFHCQQLPPSLFLLALLTWPLVSSILSPRLISKSSWDTWVIRFSLRNTEVIGWNNFAV